MTQVATQMRQTRWTPRMLVNECASSPVGDIDSYITASAVRYNHIVAGRPAAVDLSIPIIMGKLIVDLGVSSGGIYGFGVDRGFHTYGAYAYPCSVSYDSREHNGDCRLNAFDGLPHGDSNNVNVATSISGTLQAALQELAVNAAGQGWDYFLNGDGSVRWADVGFTGYSSGATTATRIAAATCVYRAVSRSGPDDNDCGNGPSVGDYDLVNHTWPTAIYDASCYLPNVSAWLDEIPASPMDRFYSFSGKSDGTFGDYQFSVNRLGGGYLGEPVNVSTTSPGDAGVPYNGSHRFYANDGHSSFDGSEYWDALGVAWGVPQENMDYAAAL